MTINIVNKHYHKPTENDIYVGRPTCLGNPYSHLDKNTLAKFKCETREDAIEEYATWLCQKIMTRDLKVISFLRDIKAKSENGDVNLVCWCSPNSCHGSVIKVWIESKLYDEHIKQKEPG